MSSSRPLRPVRRQGVDPGVFAARAIGRSPEEHERLERMLAARRRRRDATDSGLPATAVAIAEQEGRLRQEEELRRLEELRQLEELRWGREQLRQQLQLRSAEDIVRQRQGGHGGLLLPPPWPPSPPWRHLPALDGSTAQRRAALLAPFGFERRRPARRRLCRGKGWHRKGWRDLGMMWINVKAGSEYTRGQDVRQDSTLKDFVRQVQNSQEGTGFRPEGRQTWDLLFCKQSLRHLLESMETEGLQEADVLVRDLLDGGETVYYRIYDEDGVEQKYLD